MIQVFVVKHISERQKPDEPNDSMTRPLEKLAMSLEASNLYKVQQKRNKLLRQLHITLQNIFQKLWNNSLLSFKPGVRIDLKISVKISITELNLEFSLIFLKDESPISKIEVKLVIQERSKNLQWNHLKDND